MSYTEIAAISTGPQTHLDHLAPFCALHEIPLLVTNEEHLDLGKKFYPMVDIRYIPLEELSLEYIAANFEKIVTCGKFWAMELQSMLKMLYQKELHFIFIPHGHSDKEELLNRPVDQDIHFSYRELGNFRYDFYLKHKAHFDRLAEPFFQTDKINVLYAPTWETNASPTSFFDSTGAVVEALADQYNLLIKLHPLLEENDPARFHRIIGKYEAKARFILDFPPVYPLLEKTDVYLGDFSSIGYDFLTYNRPMYFLNSKGKLCECGEPFKGSVAGRQEHLSTIRARTYRETFEKEKASALPNFWERTRSSR